MWRRRLCRLYALTPVPVSFSYAVIGILLRVTSFAAHPPMLTSTSPAADLDGLRARLERAHRCTPTLFWRVLETACPRSAKLGDCAEAHAIRRLIEAEAWTDAALALVKLELPLWIVRRLQLDCGEWHCALSQHRDLPDWLDDAKEAHHADLALAILSALLEARSMRASDSISHATDVEASGVCSAICCENFS